MTSLSKNVKLSIEQNAEAGSFVVRSKTESFNLEHIVDKDIVSFYNELSKYGIVDTGILPLSGSGLLAIRSAGNHTQITFQHAPQISYINWGAREGDKNASTYLVAQPYRIWIGDTIDGNLYGARMFYSPNSITSANQPLYHVNLPNTNCVGYRGNGVGWQCLYHRDDWSKLPFNEKVVRFAERCSGVETFNDANMSETDGPRFYQSEYTKRHPNDYSAFSYLWNPGHWQEKTSQEGIGWALDQSIWIPVKVAGLDDQSKHQEDGTVLTLGMALIGNYAAYYNDPYIPKPINALTRSDLSTNITPEMVTSWIMRSHNSSKVVYVPTSSMESSALHRENVANKKVHIPVNHDIDDENENIVNFTCPISGQMCSGHEDDVLSDSLDNVYCVSCYEDNVIYCENTDMSYPSDHENVYYHEPSGNYYDVGGAIYAECPNCKHFHIVSAKIGDKDEDLSKYIYSDDEGNEIFCTMCSSEYLSSNYPDYKSSCYVCSTTLPVMPGTEKVVEKFSHIVHFVKNVYLDANDDIVQDTNCLCPSCNSNKGNQCPTGHYTVMPVPKLPVPILHTVPGSHFGEGCESRTVEISHMCGSCANPEIWNKEITIEQIGNLSTLFNVVSRAEDRFNYAFAANILCESPYVFEHKSPEDAIDTSTLEETDNSLF